MLPEKSEKELSHTTSSVSVDPCMAKPPSGWPKVVNDCYSSKPPIPTKCYSSRSCKVTSTKLFYLPYVKPPTSRVIVIVFKNTWRCWSSDRTAHVIIAASHHNTMSRVQHGLCHLTRCCFNQNLGSRRCDGRVPMASFDPGNLLDNQEPSCHPKLDGQKQTWSESVLSLPNFSVWYHDEPIYIYIHRVYEQPFSSNRLKCHQWGFPMCLDPRPAVATVLLPFFVSNLGSMMLHAMERYGHVSAAWYSI